MKMQLLHAMVGPNLYGDLMKNLGILIALMTLANTYSITAHAGTALICEAQGLVDKIIAIHSEEAFPEKQVCTMINDDKVTCVNGALTDLSLELSSVYQAGIGTTRVVLQHRGMDYQLSKTFDCDWINGEEHCGMNTPTETLAEEDINCMMVRD
jgi:hypothetical protein